MSVLYDGEWGTICRIGWGFADTQVACRDAGYPYAAGDTRAFGFGKIWLANVQCQGNESKLANCAHPGWGNVYQTCTHGLDVGVECVPTSKYTSFSNRNFNSMYNWSCRSLSSSLNFLLLLGT